MSTEKRTTLTMGALELSQFPAYRDQILIRGGDHSASLALFKEHPLFTFWPNDKTQYLEIHVPEDFKDKLKIRYF